MQRHLVIGHRGEIGGVIYKILNEAGFIVDGKDKEPWQKKWKGYEIMHVCIPYSDTFVDTVREYARDLANDGLLIIHSTVPVGTTRLFGKNAVHSPVRGKHPDLEPHIRTFVKALGGPRAQEAAAIFSACGISTVCRQKPEETEAAKLFDLQGYGLSIIHNKEVKKYCDENGLDFDFVYRSFTQSYNEGYKKMGMTYFTRPILHYMPGGIGKHCVRQAGCDLMPNAMARFILERHEVHENYTDKVTE